MRRTTLTLVLAGLVFGSQGLLAKEKDTIYVLQPGKKKDEVVTGKITQDTPAGIKIKPDKGEERDISPSQIHAVDYGEGVDAVGKIEYHSGDNKLDRALLATRSDKKQEELRLAMLAYQTLAASDKLGAASSAQRYFRYRIAQTQYYLAREDANQRDAAITALKEFKTNFADGWEIVPALQLLATLQEDKGDTEAAAQTFADLAQVPGITEKMKLQSQLKGARLMMAVKKFADAEKKLKDVEAKLPPDDPQRAHVEVYLIQARIAQKGNLNGVDAKLHQVVRSSKDPALLASAHNALGDYYRIKDDLAQAFWEYCKVDVLYNQDREEHAKALYYLSQLYDRPRGNPNRAEEALTRLKSSQFDGTLYQRQAMAEKKKAD